MIRFIKIASHTVGLARALLRAAANTAAVAMVAGSLLLAPVAAEEFDTAMEIEAAMDALDNAHQNLGGMGGLGVIPQDDLEIIHELLGDAERLIREARLRAQQASTPGDDAWIVAHARAGLAMAAAANEYRANRGY